MTDGAFLRRFVVDAARLEPDLVRWTAAAVWAGLSASRRRRIRDDLLRQAARLLPPESAWRKAHLLAELARHPGSRPGVSTAAGLVALASAVYCPSRRDRDLSASQIFRIVNSRIRPIEMEADEDVLSNPMLGIFLERENEQ